MRIAKWMLIVMILAELPAAGQKVTVDWDDTVDFSGYTTYVWMKDTPAPGSLESQIRDAIDSVLADRGMQSFDGAADFYLVTHSSVDDAKSVDADSHDYGGYYGWQGWEGWGGASTDVNVHQVQVGTVLLDILDGRSKKLVWRAVASGTVKQTHVPEKRNKRIQKVAAKMLKKFPPPVQ
jgi:hypothetical protein